MLEEDLTRGEKLFLDRRRKKLTQRQAAARYSTTLYAYRRWEEDLSRPPTIKIKGMEPHEHYVIMRVRAGLGLAQMARMMGLSRGYLGLIESGHGSLARLVEYWS